MRSLVPLVLLLLASSLFAAEIPISQPEVIPIDLGEAHAQTPGVAAGDGFAAVWSERFNFTDVAVTKLRTYDDDGTPRQTLPVIVGAGNTPHVFWNGSEYVVVLAVPFSRFGSTSPLPSIVAVRVRPDGTVVPGFETLATARSGSTVIAVAWDGANALAAVNHNNSQHLLLLDRDGRLVTDTPIAYVPADIAVKPGGGFFVLRADQGSAIAAGGDRFAVLSNLSSKSGGVTAAILDSAGTELERFTLAGEGGYAATVAWDGRAWVGAYVVHGSLCTARFTSSADVGRTCGPSGSASSPALAVGPRGVFKVWNESGQVATDAGIASTTLSTITVANATVDDRGLVAAWIETVPGGAQIRIGGVNNDGTPRPEYGLPVPITMYDSVRLAHAGNQTLLVWSQGGSMHGALLDESLEPPESYLGFRDGTRPAVAARGNEWLIVWAAPTGIEAEHMSAAGGVTELVEFGGPAIQFEPAVAATSSGYLVVWWESEQGQTRLVVEPLDAGGKRTRGGNRIVENRVPITYPAVGCGPQTCLVTWSGGSGEMWATLVRHDGTKISAEQVFSAPVLTPVPIIEPLADGSFLVWHGSNVTPVSKTGVPGLTQRWTSQSVGLANIVNWRGNRTAVYSRRENGASRLFAFELTGRARSVRH